MRFFNYFFKKEEEKKIIKKEKSFLYCIRQLSEEDKKFCFGIIKIINSSITATDLQVFFSSYMHSNNGKNQSSLIKIGGKSLVYFITYSDKETFENQFKDFANKISYFWPHNEEGILEIKIGEYFKDKNYKKFLEEVQNTQPSRYVITKKDK